jgi:hypothetical protein
MLGKCVVLEMVVGKHKAVEGFFCIQWIVEIIFKRLEPRAR